MDISQYVALGLEGIKQGLTRVLDGLDRQELSWRPASGCNSIGLILFHTVRFEDVFVQTRIQGKPEVWAAEKWYQKLDKAEADVGAHYSTDQVNRFRVPELKDILAYFEAVRAGTQDYLGGLNSEAFDGKIQTPRYGEVSVGFMLSRMIGHAQQHIGEMSYLRGLQRGMDK